MNVKKTNKTTNQRHFTLEGPHYKIDNLEGIYIKKEDQRCECYGE